MRDAYLTLPTYALGEVVHTVEDSVAAGRTVTDLAGLRGAGFERHCICEPRTTAFDLARAAVEPIASQLGALDAIVYATCLPLNGNVGDEALYTQSRDVKYLMDYPASRLQACHNARDRGEPSIAGSGSPSITAHACAHPFRISAPSRSSSSDPCVAR